MTTTALTGMPDEGLAGNLPKAPVDRLSGGGSPQEGQLLPRGKHPRDAEFSR